MLNHRRCFLFLFIVMNLSPHASGADGWKQLDQTLSTPAAATTLPALASHLDALMLERNHLIPPQVPQWFRTGQPVIEKLLLNQQITLREILWALSLTRPGDSRVVEADWIQAGALIRAASFPRSSNAQTNPLSEALQALSACQSLGPITDKAARDIFTSIAKDDLPTRLAFPRAFPAIAVGFVGAWDDLIEAEIKENPKGLTPRVLDLLAGTSPSQMIAHQAVDRLIALLADAPAIPDEQKFIRSLSPTVSNPYFCQGNLTDDHIAKLKLVLTKGSVSSRALTLSLLLADLDRARLEKNLVDNVSLLSNFPVPEASNPPSPTPNSGPYEAKAVAFAFIPTDLLTPQASDLASGALNTLGKSPHFSPASVLERAALVSLAWRTAKDPQRALMDLTWIADSSRPVMPTETSYVQEFILPALGDHPTQPPESSIRPDAPLHATISLLNLYPQWEAGATRLRTEPTPTDENTTWSLLRVLAHHPKIGQKLTPKSVADIANGAAMFPAFARRGHLAAIVLNEVCRDPTAALGLIRRHDNMNSLRTWTEWFSLLLKIAPHDMIVETMQREWAADQDPGARVLEWILGLWHKKSAPFPTDAYAQLGRSRRVLEVANAIHGSQHLLKDFYRQLRDPRALCGLLTNSRSASDTIALTYPDKQAWASLHLLMAIDAVEWTSKQLESHSGK